MLAASYGREAFHLVLSRAERDDPSPIRLAYALRWLELRDGATGPSWPALLLTWSTSRRRSGRLVEHPLDGLRRVLGRVDRVLELAVKVAPLDDLERVGSRRGTVAPTAARESVSA